MWTLIILAALNTDCYVLSDADQRAFCLAIQSENVSYCYNVHSEETRLTCLAEIHHSPSICDGITDLSARQICRSRAN